MATLTKSTGTVALSGAVEKVTLPASYGWVWVKNMSEGDIFAGLSADISEGADGVLTIPSGECGRIQTDGFSSIYLLGTGNALVVAQNYADCPFKGGAKGGEAPDLSEYAKTADVPNIKVDEAVNAEAVGGYSPNILVRNFATGNPLTTSIDECYITGTYGIEASFTPDFPTGYGTFGFLDVRAYGATCYQTIRFENGTIINRGRVVGQSEWSTWKKLVSIKSATFSATADGTGNFNLWAPSENKVPISIQLDNKTFYAIPFLYNSQLWLGSTINEVTRQPVADTTVSGTVYYIEI